MNHFLPLLLILFLLTGCAAQEPSPGPAESLATDAPEPTAPFLERLEDGRTVPKYLLEEDVTDFLVLEDHLLFFCGEERTTLVLADPARQQVIATYETAMALTTKNESVQLLTDGISWFHGESEETVVLNDTLQENCRIPAPADLTGMPLLSQDGHKLYYCTSSALRVLDTTSGISRVLREIAYPIQRLSGLLLEDTALQLSITDPGGIQRTLFLSSETGQLLGDYGGNVLPETLGNRYYLRQQEGSRNTFFFGTAGEDPMVLKPWAAVENSFFLGNDVLITSWNQDHQELHLYALDSGLRISFFGGLQPGEILQSVAQDRDGRIWLLCDQEDGKKLLYHWDPSETETKDTNNYISPRYTRQEPDLDGLTACNLFAQELSHHHGVEVLIYTEATAAQPPDYQLEYEYDAAALYQELELLDQRLSNYPSGFLERLASKFSGVRLCLVRQIRGKPESGNTSTENHLTFWNGYAVNILLAVGQDTEDALYHELCHLIDTVVLTESTAYDSWENWNPSGFQYANADFHTLDPEAWRQAGWETFLDSQSMCYPQDDRAQVMVYAMASGNEDLFQSPYLQGKLNLLCTGIREAFHLESVSQSFLWEQYLQAPLINK